MIEPIPSLPPSEDPVAVMREARSRFIAAFPKRADSIGLLLNMVVTLGPKGPVGPLAEIVHRTAGLAGTLGFPTVTDRAKELETILEDAGTRLIDGAHANRVFDSLRDGFADDLGKPPAWSLTSPGTRSSRRVMVVEDDEDQREVVAIHLRAAGFVVLPVAAGDLVLEAAREHKPDLILLDANLPGQDGYSVCRAIKTDPELAHTPIIFTTVRAKVDDKAVGLMLGADEYLTKPLDLSELPLRISVLIDRRPPSPTVIPASASARQVPPEPTATSAPASATARQIPPEPTVTPTPAATPDFSAHLADLDYESFVTLCRANLETTPAVLALVRVPEQRLMETLGALHGDLRRRDIVACYDSSHLILFMAGMPPAKAAARLTDIVALLDTGSPSTFLVGVAYSSTAGAKRFETLLGEADRALASARARHVSVAIAEA
jgi:CheY-like chemotaxis protein